MYTLQVATMTMAPDLSWVQSKRFIKINPRSTSTVMLAANDYFLLYAHEKLKHKEYYTWDGFAECLSIKGFGQFGTREVNLSDGKLTDGKYLYEINLENGTKQ